MSLTNPTDGLMYQDDGRQLYQWTDKHGWHLVGWIPVVKDKAYPQSVQEGYELDSG